jgi:NusB family.
MKLSPLFYAYKCLDSIIRNGAYSGIELNRFLNTADKNEKALITRIVYGVLDKQIELDYIIHLYAKKIKPSIMPAIEIGVYMLKYMNIPDYAVVNETVN